MSKKYNCDICGGNKDEPYYKIISDTYGICDNPDCEEKARAKAWQDFNAVLASEDFSYQDGEIYQDLL